MTEFETGSLTPEELECVFGNLPFEVTFVDEGGIVRFYNRPPGMVFTRSEDILGRSVLDCHSEKSRPVVERVLADLKSGKLDVAEFVKQVDGRIMHIRYVAARDRAGAYLGCLEVAQDITRIKTLEPGRE
jgi:PAS domain S-box-containing protein